MRHRKRGRRLGRSSSHRKAMLRNLASSVFLTERETDPDLDENAPKVKGRVITTLEKAKEVRSLVEKCITIARRSLHSQREAERYATTAERHSDKWRQWRNSEQWQQWNQAIAPSIAARRRVVQLIGDKQAMRVLFEEIAPRFEDRNGGYTRVLRLAKPRLGDAGTRAVLELVGVHDRIKAVSERPAFEDFQDEGLQTDVPDQDLQQDEPQEPAADTVSSPDTEARPTESSAAEPGEEPKAEGQPE
jgi:large subunit ribosomal protein L17